MRFGSSASEGTYEETHQSCHPEPLSAGAKDLCSCLLGFVRASRTAEMLRCAQHDRDRALSCHSERSEESACGLS